MLAARGLGRRLPDGGWLLRDVTFSLRPGDRVALRGPSGSGKTQLLRSLALLEPLDAGELAFRDHPVTDAATPRYRSRVVYLHQTPALVPGTVEANLEQPFSFRSHRQRTYSRRRAVELLGELRRGEGFLNARADDLSGGEAQIVALVRALLLEPEILLLDEPSAALDPSTAGAAESLISAWLGAARERAYIWVTHDPALARRVADRGLLAHAGRLEWET